MNYLKFIYCVFFIESLSMELKNQSNQIIMMYNSVIHDKFNLIKEYHSLFIKNQYCHSEPLKILFLSTFQTNIDHHYKHNHDVYIKKNDMIFKLYCYNINLVDYTIKIFYQKNPLCFNINEIWASSFLFLTYKILQHSIKSNHLDETFCFENDINFINIYTTKPCCLIINYHQWITIFNNFKFETIIKKILPNGYVAINNIVHNGGDNSWKLPSKKSITINVKNISPHSLKFYGIFLSYNDKIPLDLHVKSIPVILNTILMDNILSFVCQDDIYIFINDKKYFLLGFEIQYYEKIFYIPWDLQNTNINL